MFNFRWIITHFLNRFIVRLRDSYKRYVKTWIRFANPWIRTVLWITNPDFKRFVSFRDWRIRIRFVSWITNPSCFQKIRFVDLFRRLIFKRLACFYESYESLRILSTIAQNESLKIKIRESESLRILKIRIRESGFVTTNLKDLYRGFISWIHFWKIRFVDSFRENFFSKLLD